jgi:hypothetical protein
VGELLDKLTILEIKTERIDDPEKLQNVERELKLLRSAWKQNIVSDSDLGPLVEELKAVNDRLWIIEDEIRLRELDQVYDDRFIELARSVYIENDRRASLKRRINMITGSDLIEEKEYPAYHGTRRHSDGER